jgi:two-component system phosphate regulon sensor histidine kinase PhoR
MALRGRERPEEVIEVGPVALHLRASPVRGGHGNGDIGHVVIAIDDVSQLKALERMKAQFISNISHELRTPLTAIKLYAQLLRRKWETDGWGDQDVAGYLDALEREITHQAALVEEVLNFARLDAGKATLELEKVDIVEIVQAVWVEMQVMASTQGLEFCFEADEPLWGEVDVGKVQRAVRNLLINAIRYTEAGGRVIVAVHPCLFADGREGACIRVEDTGMGIAESDLEHLFERFYRGEEVQRRQIPGTGLGLAIVKEVVRLHQGMCTVHSEVGKGTTFTIRLPLHPRKNRNAVGEHPLERRPHDHATRR